MENNWKEKLDDETYHVTREKGTEAPFTGKYHDHKEKGKYTCSNCGKEIFSSKNKYDSGSGWPSFDQPVSDDNIRYVPDSSGGMERMEVICEHCSAHLGHVFSDGPTETTGRRYCINSLSLGFKKDE
ncbi:MAG: peptide-methionine (R)-S-oxide reductase [Candidatus Paceibacteria bacterium]|jgi:peptide-methionine (R)-S-oxide reductase